MKLSTYFAESELDIPNDDRIRENARFLCSAVLDPIREHYSNSVHVTSGYRSNGHNVFVGGKPTSFHLFNDGKAAADICLPGIPVTQVFLWLRMVSGLPFDKAILEHKNGVPEIIHIQTDRFNPPRRKAYMGGVGDSHDYVQVEVA